MDTPGMRTIKAKFDGKVFVPTEPVEFPIGSTVTVAYAKQDLNQMEWHVLIDQLAGASDDPTFKVHPDLPNDRAESW
jgi:hypothetical protein